MPRPLKVLAFAGAQEIVGAAEFDWPLATACTVTEFVDAMCQRFTGLTAHRSSIRVAVNGQYAAGDERVLPGDEVALIPPVAGG